MDPGRRGCAEPRSSRGSGCREAEEELSFPVKNAGLSLALAAAPAVRQGQDPGPEPGARRTGRRHGAGALGVGLNPAWPGRLGVSGLRRLPAPGAAEKEDSVAPCPRCPPDTSRLRSGLSLRGKGERENKEKTRRAVRKRRVRLEGVERAGVPGLLCPSRGFFPRMENELRGERLSVEEKRYGRFPFPSLLAHRNPAKAA